MAEASTDAHLYVTVGSATTSDHLSLPNGKWVLECTSSSAYVLDIQVSGGTDFKDMYYDATTVVTLNNTTGPALVKVDGGLNYRMDVTTYNSTITMKAHKVG